MDWNYVLAWLAGSAAVFWLVVLTVRHRLSQPGWSAVSLIVLALLLAGAAVWPDRHGWVAAVAWVVLVVLPSVGARLLERCVLAERYRAAAALARGIAVLHPCDGWRQLPRKIDVLGRTRLGDAAAARALLEEGDGEGTSAGRFAKMEILRAEGRWAEGRRWVEEEVSGRDLAREPSLRLFYLRALGETGDIEALLAAHARAPGAIGPFRTRALPHLFAAAFTGRVALVERLLDGPLACLSPALGAFWWATALQAAGEAAAAAPILERLAASPEGSVRRAAASRLSEPVRVLAPEALSPAARAALDGFEREVDLEIFYSWGGPRRARLATAALIALNLFVYWIEIPGGPEDIGNLIRLGALLVPLDAAGGEWWRVLTAGFLHFGPVHLAMNLLGLWIIGGYVERTWGRWRFLAGYFGSMIGSAIATLVILTASGQRPMVFVGASGGVLGVLGVGLASVLVGWRRLRAAVLRRQLAVFCLIIALQVLFDHFTPMVSSTAHLSGLAIGFTIGLPFALARSRQAPGVSGPRTRLERTDPGGYDGR
jgi:rhomboid protease GluP